MMAPLVMLPTQIGMFLGVKYMCDLPLPQLAAESWQWIPSLTVADPTYMLPLINMVLVQGTLWLAQKDSATEKAGHTLNAFRVIALTGLPVMSTLPAVRVVFVLSSWYSYAHFHSRPLISWFLPNHFSASSNQPHCERTSFVVP
jgi:YidC/Oxa1 family membrane protein insertase